MSSKRPFCRNRKQISSAWHWGWEQGVTANEHELSFWGHGNIPNLDGGNVCIIP